jgi:hypothetical protein
VTRVDSKMHKKLFQIGEAFLFCGIWQVLFEYLKKTVK